MIEITNAKVYSDVSTIIKMMHPYMREKIDINFINYIENNKDKDYISKIDINKPINKQEINYDVKVILAYIYRQFFCSGEEKIEESQIKSIIELSTKNIKKDLWKKSKTNNYIKQEIVVYKSENLLEKLLRKIKNIFSKKETSD